jgi:hypothetical protein
MSKGDTRREAASQSHGSWFQGKQEDRAIVVRRREDGGRDFLDSSESPRCPVRRARYADGLT